MDTFHYYYYLYSYVSEERVVLSILNMEDLERYEKENGWCGRMS